MTTRATLTVSLILVGWSALIWFNRAQVMTGRPLVHAALWMTVGLVLMAKGLIGLRDAHAADAPRKHWPALAWLIGSLPLFTWLAARWKS